MAVTRCTSLWHALKRTKVRNYLWTQPTNASSLSYFSTCWAQMRAEALDLGLTQNEPVQNGASDRAVPYKTPEDMASKPRIKQRSKVLRPQDSIRNDLIDLAKTRGIALPPGLQTSSSKMRLPRSVQALYLQPLRRTPTHGIPVANLQLRSFSVRNLELVADFAVRAAYYLNLPAKGPVPLPRITERWTVPRSNFIFKKSQENFERVTVRRLVQVLDGHPEVVQRWLAFVRRWCWYGVGMKADVFEYEGLEVSKRMDEAGDAIVNGIDSVKWELFGRRRGLNENSAIKEQLQKQGFSAPESDLPKQTPDTRVGTGSHQ